MKVSFDFDGVLSRTVIQQFAQELLTAGVEVWIVTMRFATRERMIQHLNDPGAPWQGNDDLFTVAGRLGIPRERIIFTNWDWKSAAIQEHGFIWHLDDCSDTLQDIQTHCRQTRAINGWNNSAWRAKCLRALEGATDQSRVLNNA